MDTLELERKAPKIIVFLRSEGFAVEDIVSLLNVSCSELRDPFYWGGDVNGMYIAVHSPDGNSVIHIEPTNIYLKKEGE